MSFELQSVVYVVMLLFAVLVFQGSLVPRIHGFKWGLGSRDEAQAQSAMQGRAARTVANQLEGMAMYVPLILVAHVMGISTSLTVLGASLFLGGRIVFALCYLLGVPVLRSVAWGASVIGIVLILIELVRAF